MTEQNIEKLIMDYLRKLKNYNNKVKKRINVPKYNETDIQEGRNLLLEISRSEIFEEENGRTPEFDSSLKEKIEELRNELTKTSNLVRLLKGDIT